MDNSDYCIIVLTIALLITVYLPPTRYTCSVENGCEPSINGSYESLRECKEKCGR